MRFKTDHKGRGVFRKIWREINELGNAFNHLQGINGILIKENASGGYDFEMETAAAMAPRAFGWKSVSGTTVTIRGGPVQGFAGVVWIPDTAVSIGGSVSTPHLIVAEGSVAGPTGSIVATSVLKSAYSGHTAEVWRRPLWVVCLVNGRPKAIQSAMECIDLKTWYGA